MAKKNKESVMELPVSYGGLSVGDKTARIGVSISRGNLSITKADKAFCCKRLDVSIKAMSNGAQADNQPLPGMEGSDWEVGGVADVKGWSTNGKSITFGLTFNLENVEVETLSHFPKREGTLVVDAVEDIPEEEGADDDGDD